MTDTIHCHTRSIPLKTLSQPPPCIRLARLKFELTNQHSAGGKKISVLTSPDVIAIVCSLIG